MSLACGWLPRTWGKYIVTGGFASTGCCDVTVFFQPSQTLTCPDDYPPLYADILLTARLGVGPDDPEAPCCFYDAAIEWDH